MRKVKLIGKIFGITLAILIVGVMFGATALPLGDLDKNQVSGQEDASYITVHTLDLKGIEIASIEGEELFVSALVEGVNFTADSTGIYRFTITGGASEVCPPEQQPEHPSWWGWNTKILIYKNRPIYWSGGPFAPEHPNPANWDFSVGSPYLRPTYEEAEIIGKGMFVDIALAENEYVILVVNDAKGYFLDNSGGVYLSITILPPVPQYNLTIYSSAGGSVTTPSEDTFTYDEGTVVNLVAKAEEGYQFVDWTGDMDTIADVNASSTTITMNNNYSITANFEAVGGCFIATASYGTPMAEEIEILREFRDEYLLTNPLGQAFVDFYYRVSPLIAEFITENPSLKPIVRAGLVPVVAMSTVAVNTTPAGKIIIISLLVLVSVAVAAWVIRRRGKGPDYI